MLKDIILLYLPFAPISQKQEIDLRLEKQNSEELASENSIVIYITTLNLDRFKVTIILNPDNTLQINIENQGIDPNYATYLEEINEAVMREMSDNKIPAKSEFYISNNNQEERRTRDNREVSIEQPNPSISPKVMIAAYAVIRIIFEFDDKVSLINSRQQMIR